MDSAKSTTPDLRTRLIEAQFAFHQAASHGLVILISGTLSADVEDAINRLTRWMDPRNIRIYALDERETGPAHDGIEHRPRQWWFWRRMPARGQIAIFYDGWYHDALDPESPHHAREIGKKRIDRLCRLEAMLEAERVAVLKLWLDRTPRDFETRMEALLDNPSTRWQVTARDRARQKADGPYRNAVQRLLRRTQKPAWHTIGMDQGGAGFEALGAKVLAAIEKPPVARPASPTVSDKAAPRAHKPLADFDRDWRVRSYKSKLRKWQGEIRRLTRSPAFRKRSLVILFEGLDAAGKGGTIRRLTRAIDPRQWHVVPVSAPTSEEARYPWLWRFWQQVPADGDVTIFDRSWYGRVLVERVEGIAPEADWWRAYGEIRDFEADLTGHGVILVKFWLSLSADEQLRRFKAREADPHKHYKLTAEDWRNFEKREDYVAAARDMLALTDSRNAPWTLVISENKQHARIRVLRTIARRLRAALG